jgi:hypothetical protein
VLCVCSCVVLDVSEPDPDANTFTFVKMLKPSWLSSTVSSLFQGVAQLAKRAAW